MAIVAKNGRPSISTLDPKNSTRVGSGLIAGTANIAPGDACYIASTGLVELSNAASTSTARVDGYAFEAANIGQAITLYTDIEFAYSLGMTPGTKVYVGSTTSSPTAGVAGGLDTLVQPALTTTYGGGFQTSLHCGIVIDATRIRLFRTMY